MLNENSLKLIPVPKPFDFNLALQYLSRSPLECMHFVDQYAVSKLISVGEYDYLIVVFMRETNQLAVEIQWTNAPRNDWKLILDYVKNWFDFNTELSDVYGVFDRDLILKPLIGKFKGLRIIGIFDLFEAICWAIIGQQINLTFAYQVKRNLVERYGQSIDFNNRRYYLFPTPSTILDIHAEEWKEMKFSKQKTRYIKLLAEQFVSGDLSKSQLMNLDDTHIKSRLLKLMGIGDWSAEYVMMRCFRIGSAFPMMDAGLHQALKQALSLNRKPTREELESLSRQWNPWQAYATFYLWQSLH